MVLNYTDARLRDVELVRVTISGGYFEDVDIDAHLSNVRINGVDVGPLIEAELDRMYPERLRLRPTDLAGYLEAFALTERLWEPTIARARALDPLLLDERVDGEWSFIETQRHLVFATDCWFARALLGQSAPWHPLGLRNTEAEADDPPLPWAQDNDSRPGLEEILALRSERFARIRDYLGGLTEEQLAGASPIPDGEGWPPRESFPVTKPLGVLLNEEFWHRRFAERDLDILSTR